MIRKNSFSTLPLEKLAKQVNYGFTASANQKGNSKLLRITDIQDDRVNWSSVPFCNCEEEDRKKYILEPGDIVFARTGATTGKSFLIQNCPKNSVFASYLIRVRPSSDVHSQYLSWFFQTPNYWNQITRSASGSTQPGVNATKLKKLRIPLPPLEEQKRIAAILDKADAIRRSRKEAIALTKELLRSTFLDMFGDPGRNPKGWEKAYVTDIAEKVTDGTHHTPERTSTGIKLLSARNIKNGYIDVSNSVDFIPQSEFERLQKRYSPKPQDVLISCSGSVGRVTVVRDFEPFSMVRSVAVIRPKSDIINPEFLESLLLSPYLQASILRGSKKSSQANLFQGAIKELPVIIPPLPVQNQWNNYKCRLLNLVNQHSCLSRLNSNLFNSLLQKAFRGEL